MISELSITNFKIYKEKIDIPLSKINLLTGVNGKGKSTTLQVFLILAQSVFKNRTSNSINLNGECVNLGNLLDIKNSSTVNDKPTEFRFKYNEFEIVYRLENEDSSSSELKITNLEVNTNSGKKYVFKQSSTDNYQYQLDYNELNSIVEMHTLYDLFIDSNSIDQYNKVELKDIKSVFNLNYLHYVSADRIGPKSYYEKKALGHFISVGALGDDVANVLYFKSNDLVDSRFFNACCTFFELDTDLTSRTVENFVNIWLNAIFNGAGVQVEKVQGEEILKLRIKTSESSGFHKPTNVGYGFSYFLPILVAGLIAKPGELLIVENPEAHLHPSAQSAVAKFLALISLSDVQVLIESHSEHILNGLRISVYDELLKPEEINVLYFDSKKDQIYTKIQMDEDGGIDIWPKDFFDQSTKDLNYLFGI